MTEPAVDRSLELDAVRGDPAAIDALWRLHAGAATGYATRILGRREEAEEVVNDSFLKVVTGRAQADRSFRSYLFTVVHRACLDQLRRREVRTRLWPVIRAAIAPVPAPDEALEQAGEQAALERALRKLSVEHRAVVLLYYREELSSREVAEVLGTSDQQVRSQLSYARRKLRALIEEEDV